MLQNEEFIQEFVEEASYHVDLIEKGLLNLEETSEDLQVVNDIFRSIHSIKGTAGFFGLSKIVDLSHKMESLLGEIRSGGLKINSIMIDTLLSANDCLKEMIQNVYSSHEMDILHHNKVLQSFLEKNNSNKQKPVNRSIEVESGKNSIKEQLLEEAIRYGQGLYRVTLDMKKDIDELGLSPIQFFKKIQSIGTIIDSFTHIPEFDTVDSVFNSSIILTFLFTSILEMDLLHSAIGIKKERINQLDINQKIDNLVEYMKNSNLHETSEEQLIQNVGNNLIVEDSPKAQVQNNAAPVVEDSIRVHVSLLNNLLNLSSELVLGRNQLITKLDHYRKEISGIDSILQNIDTLTTELQEKIMQTRMQPVGNVFNKMNRVVRDLAKKLGKEVELIIEGSDVELDKSIVEGLNDPLTHLIRNAIDHGVESPEKRYSKGKKRAGEIKIRAYYDGGYVNIDIIDDGKGINPQELKEKAFEKGIVTPEEIRDMGDKEALKLLMRPGFSTADQITDVSGRGVGMDVVKTNIEKLGGMVEIYTNYGKGTNFRLILPLTLAIIPSLIVGVHEYRFALPKVNLQEMVRIKKGDETKKIEYVNEAQVLRLREKLLPIIRLSDLLGIKEEITGEEKITRILVLKVGSKKFGLIIDKIFDEEEILVKPLPAYFKSYNCYFGVTILGNGKTAMILDPEGIITKVGLKFFEEENKARANITLDNEKNREQQNIILFKCSGDETFAMDLSLVARVEEISKNSIERVGDKHFIQYRGDSLRVIRPEDYLPVSKNDSMKEKLYVIVPKLVSTPIGFIIEKIEDTLTTNIQLNSKSLSAKGILGSTILKDKIILLINMYEIFEMVDPKYYANENLRHKEKSRILLVEDTPFFAKLEKDYLEWAGYEVCAASDGIEALELLEKVSVDAIVSDIQMPRMDGIELARNIRKNSKYSHLPIIAVTSMTGEQHKKLAIESGFDYYQFKLDKIKLLEVLKKVLKGDERFE